MSFWQVFFVFTFSTQHPGGERAVVSLTGKDATAAKCASGGINEVDGSGKAKDGRGPSKSALSFGAENRDAGANWEAWRDRGEGDFGRRARSPVGGSSVVRECLPLPDSQHHLRDLCRDFLCKEPRGLDWPYGHYTKCRFLDPFSSWCMPTGKCMCMEGQTV